MPARTGNCSAGISPTSTPARAGIGTPYRVADLRIEYAPADSPLLQGSYRGLAATANNFARESIIDELAWQLGQDPVTFRLRNLADDRLAAVLRAVADHIGWPADPDDSAAGEAGRPAGASRAEWRKKAG